MFTFLRCLLLATLAFSSACHEDCWFRKKTRGSKDICYGDARPLPADLARVLGAPGYACLKHRRALEREDERCSSVLLLSHSKTLTTIPQKLCQFLDERGKTVVNYQPGGRWCHKCRTSYYREIRMVSLFLVFIKKLLDFALNFFSFFSFTKR